MAKNAKKISTKVLELNLLAPYSFFPFIISLYVVFKDIAWFGLIDIIGIKDGDLETKDSHGNLPIIVKSPAKRQRSRRKRKVKFMHMSYRKTSLRNDVVRCNFSYI